MRIALNCFVVLLCAILVGCQTGRQAQFVVPEQSVEVLVERLSKIATAHGMTNCMNTTRVVGVIVCFKEGDTSFTFLGARKKDSKMIVDLGFRSAGIGGKLFNQLHSEVGRDLRELYGSSVQEIDTSKMIPIEYNAA